MKTRFLSLCGSLALAGLAAAAPAVNVYGKGFYNDKTVVLHVLADSLVQLRSFGLRIAFDPAEVQLQAAMASDALWFLCAQPGQRSPYQAARPAPGSVRVVGARFEGTRPGQGVGGTGLCLFTLQFARQGGTLPKFQVALAGPAGYASFITTGGAHVDDSVDGLGTLGLSYQQLSPDTDGDGIPDQTEMDWFGTLDRANATSDSDGDGAKDRDEWIGGTSAADPKSVTRLVFALESVGKGRLSWTGQPGRVYDLLWSKDLVNFTPVVEGIFPGPANTFVDELLDSVGFYRLRIHFPEGGQ